MVAAAIVGGAVVGGVASNMAASQSSGAIRDASSASTGEQQREFDLAYQAQAPYRQVGASALNQLATLYGLPQAQPSGPSTGGGYYGGGNDFSGMRGGGRMQRPGVTVDQTGNVVGGQPAGRPDYSAFYNTPDYQFARDQGLQAIQNSAAARGGLFSGNAGRGIVDYASGVASQNYNNYTNRLAALAGIGQTSATNTGNQAIVTGQSIGANMLAAGNARASGIQQGYAGINNAIQGGMSNYLYYQQMQQNPYVTPYGTIAGGGGNTLDAGGGYTFTH